MTASTRDPGFLLDTHVLLRWHFDAERIPQPVTDVLRSANARVVISVCSLWEIRIKQRTGKLKLPDRFIEVLRSDAMNRLDITTEHSLAAGMLDPIHGDPFDRMLVAQAQFEGLTLITADRKLAGYNVQILDAKPKRLS